MAIIERFEDIEGWKAARVLTRMVCEALAEGPSARDWRLRDQITGAAISVMANIAEGFGSNSNSQFITFLGYARRSAVEVQSLLCAALDRQYLSAVQFDAIYHQAETTLRLIGGFVRYLRARRGEGWTTGGAVASSELAHSSDPRTLNSEL